MIAKTLVCIAFMSSVFANVTPQFDLINVVWGKEYTDAFLKTSLPLQFCPGNFGSFPSGSARYRLFTTRADWETMQSDPNMKKLQEMIPVEFVEITIEGVTWQPWTKMIECHNRAIQDAAPENRALIILSPDCLLANNVFQTIVQNAQEGKRCILIMGVRTKKEEMIPLIETALHDEETRQNGIDPRRLVALSLPQIHPLSASLFFNNNINAFSPAIYWKLDDQNLLSYGFCLHPIFIWPEIDATSYFTIDDEFVFLACPTKKNWKIIQDSDEMILFEFSDETRSYRYGNIEWMKCSPVNIARYATDYVRTQHWYYIDKPMYIHSADYKEEWKEIENEANAFIDMVKLSGGYYTLFGEKP